MRPTVSLSLILIINNISGVWSDCGDVVFGGLDGATDHYYGTIKYLPKNSGAPTLADGVNEEFMEFILGCTNSVDQDEPTGPTIVEEEFRSQFEFSNLPTKISRKVLRLSSGYNIVTNQDIVFHVEACTPEDPTHCTRVTLTLSYSFNGHRPQFNDIAGEAKILDAQSCSELTPTTDQNCQVVFSKPFFATDSDGDLVTYQIIPPSHVFEIADNTDLATLYYRGTGIIQQTSIPLLIQAADTRSLDEKTNVALVNVMVNTTVTTEAPPTTSPTTSAPEEDSKENLYFILMIVFASLTGVLLLLALGLLILKLCWSNKVGRVTGPMSRKATFKKSGVFMANATFKSNSNLDFVNYDTLAERNVSSQDLETTTETKGRIKKKTKKNSRNLPFEDGENSTG